MSLINPRRCLPASRILTVVGQKFVLPVVLHGLVQHLTVADDGIQRRPKLVTHAGEKGRFVLARHLELPVEIAELLGGPFDIGGERAQFVAIADLDALGKVAGRDLMEPRVDLADRPDQR